jgi:hypothetical protein
MGEPVIIWPPGCGNFGDSDACTYYMGPGSYDCTAEYQDGGLVCCPLGG